MTRLRLDQLPPHVRARVEANHPAATPPARARRRLDGPPAPYTCHTCGTEFAWPGDTTPRAVADHQAATGHGHYRLNLQETPR